MVASAHCWKRPAAQRCLNTRAAAAYLGVTVALMRAWRLRGPEDRNAGPPFIRPSASLVVYDVDDLDMFLARKRAATEAHFQTITPAAV